MIKRIRLPGARLSDSIREKLLLQWEDDEKLVRTLLAEAETIAVPKAMVVAAPVTQKSDDSVCVNGVEVKSAHVAEKLRELDTVYPYVMTCGRELEAWAQSGDPDDEDAFIRSYICDEICKFYLGVIAAALGDYIGTVITEGQIGALNPGSLKEWPLSAQRQLFAMIPDVNEETGVTLTESCLMLPAKSSSGIFFESKEKYENCMLCPRRNCPGRRAEYQIMT